MEFITKPSLSKLARRAGIKSMSDDCYDLIRSLINMKLKEVIETVVILNDQRNTNTFMLVDLYEALSLLNHNITKSDNLTSNSSKNKY